MLEILIHPRSQVHSLTFLHSNIILTLYFIMVLGVTYEKGEKGKVIVCLGKKGFIPYYYYGFRVSEEKIAERDFRFIF